MGNICRSPTAEGVMRDLLAKAGFGDRVVLDSAGTWRYVTQWSTTVSATKGVYVLFNGRTMTSPLIRGVSGIRLTAVNGGRSFRIGMLNLTAR